MDQIEVIFFSGDSCPKCKAIKDTWEQAVSLNTKLDYRYVNTSVGDLALARQYRIQALPTFLARNVKSEAEIGRLSGEVSKKMLLDFLLKHATSE